ncbi:MAG: DUF167 domain-containing protein [Dehalococcoidia bacterium]
MSAASARIHLRVQPGASRNQVSHLPDHTLKVQVTAPPVAGQANQEVIELLAEWLGIPKGRVTLVRGHTSWNKVIVVQGVTPEEALRLLEGHR